MDNYHLTEVMYLVTMVDDDISMTAISASEFRIMRDEMEELGIEYQIFGKFVVIETTDTSFRIGG